VINQAVAAMADKAGKYLTFKLGAEEYGLEILKVQEIIKMMDITKVPRTPEFVRGVINLRGKVIPVVDLRLKFGMAAKETTDKTCVIVAQVANAGGTVTMGTIVDEVSEVLDIMAEQIEPAPEFGTTVNTDFILGMGKVAKKVIMLLDIDKVLSRGELTTVSKITKPA
jgi:purine-binding chemotaxis protein CheW